MKAVPCCNKKCSRDRQTDVSLHFSTMIIKAMQHMGSRTNTKPKIKIKNLQNIMTKSH